MLDINIQKLSLSLDPKKYNIDRVSGVFFFVFFSSAATSTLYFTDYSSSDDKVQFDNGIAFIYSIYSRPTHRPNQSGPIEPHTLIRDNHPNCCSK